MLGIGIPNVIKVTVVYAEFRLSVSLLYAVVSSVVATTKKFGTNFLWKLGLNLKIKMFDCVSDG